MHTRTCMYVHMCVYMQSLELQQIFDSFGYSLQFWYSDSKIDIRIFIYMCFIYFTQNITLLLNFLLLILQFEVQTNTSI